MNGHAPSFSGSLLSLDELEEAVFLSRKNRFVGTVRVQGSSSSMHIPDPGRLKELLYRGNRILVRKAPENSGRKTGWSLIAGMSQAGWVLTNTFLHRRLSEAILSDPFISPFGRLSEFRAEVTPPGKRSRFDFLLTTHEGQRIWLEVKGCTLRKGGRALFPDAPTKRGTRHLSELAEFSLSGSSCAVMFLVFPRGVECFSPNDETDPDFAVAFRKAREAGVRIYPIRLGFDGRDVRYLGKLEICAE